MTRRLLRHGPPALILLSAVAGCSGPRRPARGQALPPVPPVRTAHLAATVNPTTGAVAVVLPTRSGGAPDTLMIPAVLMDGLAQGSFHESDAPRAQEARSALRWANERVMLTIEPTGDRSIALTWRPAVTNPSRSTLHHFAVRIADNSSYYGCGERFSSLNHKGHILPMVSIDRPEDKGDVAYKPVPFYMSTRGYAAWLDTEAPGYFDLNATEREHVVLTYDARALRLVLIAGPSMPEMLGEFTRLTGRPRVPPKWAFAPWKSRDVHRNRAEVLQDAELTRKHDLPGSVIVIDSPWETGYNDFVINEQQFSRPREMFDRLRDLGFYTCFWLTPFINRRNLVDMPGITDGPSQNYAEAAAAGFLVHDRDGSPAIASWWKGEGSLVDLTNPKAVAWWQDQIARTLQWGVHAFKCDAGESNFIPDGAEGDARPAAQFHDGTSAHEMKNQYPRLYLKAVQDLIDRRLKGDGVLLARSGFTGTQATPLGWAGDNESTFSYENGLPSVILAGQNAAMSGMPMWGFDIAGYIGRPSKEVFIRSAQAGALSPLMMVHMQSNLGPWDFDDETLAIYRRFAKLHMALFPYLYQCARDAAATGMPIIRPMVLACPDEPDAAEHRYQYMLGPDLLVAPMVRGGEGREVYLPRGTWHHFWTGERVAGGRAIYARAPLDQMPLFVRSGAIIELLPDDVDTLIQPAKPFAEGVVSLDERRVLQVWPGEHRALDTWDGLRATPQTDAGRHLLDLSSVPARLVEIRLMHVKRAASPSPGASWEFKPALNASTRTIQTRPEAIRIDWSVAE